MALPRRIFRALRGPLGVTGICLFGFNGMAQANSTGTLPVSEPDFVRWALTQGGLVVALLIIAWSYRRDLVHIIRDQDSKVQVLTALVQEATAAQTRVADAIDRCPKR